MMLLQGPFLVSIGMTNNPILDLLMYPVEALTGTNVFPI